MDALLTVLFVLVVLIFMLAMVWKGRRRLSGMMQFTSQTVMHNFAGEDGKAAIEQIQFVQEDERLEQTGPDEDKAGKIVNNN
jgi:hypothetical protein